MEFTVFTLIMTIIWVSFFAKVISILRKQMLVLKYFSIYPLLVLLIFCLLRVFLSVEWPFTTIINVEKVLPFTQSILLTPIINTSYIKIHSALIILVIWVSGSIFIILKHIRDYFHFRNFINFFPETKNQHLYEVLSKVNNGRLLRKVKIIVHDSIQSPAIFGILNPVILLPDIDLSDDELYSIFIHESTHYQFGHIIIKYIAELIRAFFWWNPAFKKLSSEISYVLEMHSDKKVCKKVNFEQQREYIIIILKIASYITETASHSGVVCSFVEENDIEKLEQRVQMVQKGYYQTRKKLDILVIPIIIAMFILSYSIVIQPYSNPDLDYMDIVDEIDSNCYLVKSEEGYKLYDSTNNFIAEIMYIDQNLSDLKIYKNLEDAK